MWTTLIGYLWCVSIHILLWRGYVMIMLRIFSHQKGRERRMWRLWYKLKSISYARYMSDKSTPTQQKGCRETKDVYLYTPFHINLVIFLWPSLYSRHRFVGHWDSILWVGVQVHIYTSVSHLGTFLRNVRGDFEYFPRCLRVEIARRMVVT